MKKIELILIGIVVLSMILKLFHISGYEILIVLSLSSVSVIYMYFGFALFNNIGFRNILKKDSYREISSKRIIGGIVVGLSLSISSIGILFKFQSWPGASVQLLVGLLGLVIVGIISLIKMKKNTNGYYSNVLKRVAFFGAISLFLFLIPSKTWLNWKYPNNPEYVNAVIKAQENPNNQALREKVEEERKKMYEKINK